MWPFKKKKVRQRRMEVRRNISALRPPLWRRFRQVGGPSAVLLAAMLFITALVIDILPIDPVPYRAGQYIPADIYARVEFRILSQELQADLQRKAQNTSPPVFRLNTELTGEIAAAIGNFPDQLKATTQPEDLDNLLGAKFAITGEQLSQVREFLRDATGQKQYADALDRLRSALARTYIVRSETLRSSNVRRGTDKALVVHNGEETEKDISDLISLTEESKVAEKVDSLAAVFPPPVHEHVRAYLKAALAGPQPVFKHDAAETQKRIEDAKRLIETHPPAGAYKTHHAGDLLVRASRGTGEDGAAAGLSDEGLKKLRQEHEAHLAGQYAGRSWGRWQNVAGRIAILLLIVLPLSVYILCYQPRIVRKLSRSLGMVALVMLALGAGKAMSFGLGWNRHSVILPVLVATLVLTIAYDQRFAMAVGAVLSLLATFLLRADLPVFLALVAAVAATTFQLREIRSRSRLIEIAGISALVVMATVFATAASQAVPIRFALIDGLWAAGAVLLAGFGVQGMLPLIERAFGVATSMTLLEWCDASRPLLKRLAMEAPGTYNHSLQLGTMCETAAEAIGARGLLARVGAYYHDIGKINKPDYFIENQAGSDSRHAKLSPAMSLLIIIGHVKDGLEMAREYSLPKELHEFIAAHHGTTLVQYFYHAAAEKRKDSADRAPDEAEFRYPGPKPQSREAAILMLADAAESSVRAMTEPTPGQIESQVHTMVSRRLMDEQLDECELTLREVHLIEASLVKSICGIYHGRITYPTPPGEKPSAAEENAANRKVEVEATNTANRKDEGGSANDANKRVEGEK